MKIGTGHDIELTCDICGERAPRLYPLDGQSGTPKDVHLGRWGCSVCEEKLHPTCSECKADVIYGFPGDDDNPPLCANCLGDEQEENERTDNFPMLEPIGEHHYGDDGKVYEVSQAAKNEKDTNWVEFVGFADGCARVEHEDWQALWNTLVESTGKDYGVMQSFLCFAKTPTGEIAHIGSITCLGNGKFELGG